MDENSVNKIAKKFGLTVEVLELEDHDDAVRVYKGVNQIFIGTAAAVGEYLERNEKDRPEQPKPRARGYKE